MTDELNQLVELNDVSKISAILISPSMSFRFRLDEERINAAGCAYESSDPNKVKELIAIFHNSKIKKTASLDNSYEPRSVVYFVRQDGSQAKILLGDSKSGMPVAGQIEKININADPGLSKALRKWSSTVHIVRETEQCKSIQISNSLD